MEFECLSDASYVLRECAVCSLIFQRDIANDQLLRRMEEHWTDPETAFGRDLKELSLWAYSEYATQVMQVISYFGDPASLSVCDFGMGWGRWALMAKAFGCDSYGTDVLASRMEYAKANGIKTLAWQEIPEYRFDFINAESVFEHLAEPLLALRHLAGALKTGGMVRINVPDGSDIEQRLKRIDWTAPSDSPNSHLPLVGPLVHINCFRKQSLAQMAREAGMEEVAIPVRVQYLHRTDWGGPKSIVKNLLRPVYRSVRPRPTTVFLINK